MTTTHPIALCVTDLSANSGTLIRLFPTGSFVAVDGRPGTVSKNKLDHWVMDDAAAQRVIAKFQAQARKLVIDYEHQTVNTVKNGQPAPAAGWITDLEWQPESGLLARVAWTEQAKSMIQAGQYQYISPVFQYDQKTGRVLQLWHAGLTNNPALSGLGEVSARMETTIDDEEKSVSLTNIAKALGLPPEADEKGILDAIQARTDQAKATAEVQVVAEVPAQPPSAPMEVLHAMQAEIAALKTQTIQSEVEGLVAKGLQDGRIPTSLEPWARDLGGRDMAALKMFLEKAQPIAALTGQQTGGKEPAGTSGTPALSTDELAVCTATGVDPKEFVAAKAMHQTGGVSWL
ncbi:MAG: phage protease [Magnetococcales bacterium]|nr:phage protease [Magnetococcales bacterium]